MAQGEIKSIYNNRLNEIISTNSEPNGYPATLNWNLYRRESNMHQSIFVRSRAPFRHDIPFLHRPFAYMLTPV
ncbi:hypothetical protein FJU30_02895 [Affinibrenneria salicis]|uniref:Uncharacterized protein n=1 Tax=Affinibrenneria salicis TaxID=2590031 RepID=A0A5J5G6R6_9GAMM|nr:hypothetical protein [Affinibrenneria salicis]KAA9002765.1 hypothetical protein FJU30_01870 [Affinibrenneria salicis]KAA9002948.1 hypothetical protein FJU30_02895 [Affinibrenneria salicis]